MLQLRPSELAAILGELQRQMAIDELSDQRNKWNLLTAATINGAAAICARLSSKRRRPKLIEPDDLMSKNAKKLLQRLLRDNTEPDGWSKHIDDAKAKGLRGPWGVK